MRSTYLSLHYHIVFGTKNREPSIALDIRARVHEYIGGVVRRLEAIPLAVGGTYDHVHVLTGLSAMHRVADFVRDLKKTSSLWMRETIGNKGFAWQEGYAAITVGPTALEAAASYVRHQEAHHQTKSFSDELMSMLMRAHIDFDPEHFD